MDDTPKHDHPSDAEMDDLALQVVGLLDGLPLSIALGVLERRARILLLDGHRVDVNCPRFRGLRADLRANRG